MADYTTSAQALTTDPEGSLQTSFDRLEPLLGVDKLKDVHLFGLDLISNIPDPITNRYQKMSDLLLEEFIRDAVVLAEQELGIVIMPKRRLERLAFDRWEYESMGYLQLGSRPVTSVDKLTLEAPSRQSLYVVPTEWIETGYLEYGQVHIIPLNLTTFTTLGGAGSGDGAAAALFISVLGSRGYIPGFWVAEYTAGFKDGLIPREVNQYIGTVAAIEVLRQIAATNAKNVNHSMTIDGLSQSVSTPGGAIYGEALQMLQNKKELLRGKLKATYGTLFFSGTL